MFKVPETNRVTVGQFASTKEDGNNGVFIFMFGVQGIKWKRALICIASDGDGWDHVSVRVEVLGKSQTPTWDDMNLIKKYFWDKDDCVMQLHPPEEDYVNMHENVLHLWKPQNAEIPRPPKEMV